MTIEEAIKKIEAAADKHRSGIIDVAKFMWDNPETGFREWRATRYLEEKYEALGYKLVKAENIPGFYTVIDTGRPGPEILVLEELDALTCPGHFHTDANRRVNRALAGAAVSLGVQLEISDVAGSAPMIDNPELAKVAGEAIHKLLPDAECFFLIR